MLQALPHDQKWKRLRKNAGQVLGLYSILWDLGTCRESLGHLSDLAADRGPGTEVNLKDVDADLDRVFARDALLHYVRATEANSSRYFDVKRVFNERERKDHKRIIDLRNSEIVHLDHKNQDRTWHLEQIFAFRRETELNFVVQPIIRRANYLAADMQLIETLSGKLIAPVAEAYRQNKSDLEAGLTAAFRERDFRPALVAGGPWIMAAAEVDQTIADWSVGFPFDQIP